VARLLRRISTNPADVREVALAGQSLAGVRRVLELGCGFGFMAEVLAPRLPAEAQFMGVDAHAANREPFLSRLAAAGRRGSFVEAELSQELPWPEGYFDLAVSSYSLYFFPGVIPDIPRVLAPGGRLLALTHYESSVAALLEAAGLPPMQGPLMDLARRFSAESGPQMLKPWFASLDLQHYRNELVFAPGEPEELFLYLSFKLRLMVECEDGGDRPCSTFEQELRLRLAQRLAEGSLRLPKDDAVFWATTGEAS
jgi:SAM-dependent methyltransferase